MYKINVLSITFEKLLITERMLVGIHSWWNVSNAVCTAEEMRNGLEHFLVYTSNSILDTNLSRVIMPGKVMCIVKSDVFVHTVHSIRIFHSFKVI